MRGFVMVSALILSLLLLALGGAAIFMANTSTLMTVSEIEYEKAKRASDYGLKLGIESAITNMRCDFTIAQTNTPVPNMGGATYSFWAISDREGNSCLIVSEGRFGNARVRKSAIIQYPGSSLGTFTLRNGGTFTLSGNAIIQSCDPRCIGPAILTGGNISGTYTVGTCGSSSGILSYTGVPIQYRPLGNLIPRVFNTNNWSGVVSLIEQILNSQNPNFRIDLRNWTVSTSFTPTCNSGSFYASSCTFTQNLCQGYKKGKTECIIYSQSYMECYCKVNSKNKPANSCTSLGNNNWKCNLKRVCINGCSVVYTSWELKTNATLSNMTLISPKEIEVGSGTYTNVNFIAQGEAEVEGINGGSANVYISGGMFFGKEAEVEKAGSGIIGTPNNPVMFIAGPGKSPEPKKLGGGEVEINSTGNLVFNGLIFTGQELGVKISGNSQINGVIVHNCIAKDPITGKTQNCQKKAKIDISGNARITFNSSIISRLNQMYPSLVKPPSCGGSGTVKKYTVRTTMTLY